MKTAFFKSAILLGAIVGAATDVSRAQTSPAQTSPSLFGAPLPRPNGFDALIEAAKNYRHGREGWPTNPTELSPAENLRGQRYSVLRNAKTLEMVRAALKLPTVRPLPVAPLLRIAPPLAPAIPDPKTPDPNGDTNGENPEIPDAAQDFAPFDPEDGFRLLGNLLKQESGFRASSGDWNGALQSSLDCIELGVVLTRGATLQSAQIGQNIENTGRLRLEFIVKNLDATSAAAGAARLQIIESLRPPFADLVRAEKKIGLERTVQAFEQLDWNDAVMATRKPDGAPFSPAEIETLLGSGQSEIQTGTSRLFDAAIALAEAPYDPQFRLPTGGADAWSRLMVEPLLSPRPRLDYALQSAATALLKSALEAESARRKTGLWPAALQTSLDPFSSATGNAARIKYRIEGAGFRLYSVGPNGKDDNALPLAFAPGAEITSATPGDLVAPDFSG